MIFGFSSLSLLAALAAAPAPAGTPDPEMWVREAEAALGRVDSYTAIFHKQERVDGELLAEETTFLRFKKPYKVSMRWIKEPFKGREVVYVQGANDNRLRVREGGLLGLIPISLDPLGKMAMKGNRHAITEAGLINLVEKIGANLRRGLKAGEVATRDHGDELIYGRPTRRLEGVYPRDPSKGYYCYRAVVNIDTERKVPTHAEIFDWNDRLVERFGYEDLRLDAGLADGSFELGAK